MTIMTTRRSIDGGMNRLAAGVLVAALLGSTACVPATAVAQGQAPAMKTPAAAAPVAAPAASPAVQPDPAILLERARKKIKVDHDVAGAVAAYREVIEKHRADLAHARPALRELLDLWVEVQGNEAAAAAIRPAAEKYLDMQRPIDPKAAAARTDDDLARDLLLKPWLVTLKFDKAPLKEVLAEITRQSGVAIEVGTVPLPFDAAKYRAFMKKLPRYAELPDEERKAMQAEAKAMKPDLGPDGELDHLLREWAVAAGQEGDDWIDDALAETGSYCERLVQAVACEITINVTQVNAWAAIDAAMAQLPKGLPVSARLESASVVIDGEGADAAQRVYNGRMRIGRPESGTVRKLSVVGAAKKSQLAMDIDVTREPGLPTARFVVGCLIGTDAQGRKYTINPPLALRGKLLTAFADVPADVQEFVSLAGEVAGTVVAEKSEYRLPLAKGNHLTIPGGTLTVQAINRNQGATVVTLAGVVDRDTTLPVTEFSDGTNCAGNQGLRMMGMDGVFGGFEEVMELADGRRIQSRRRSRTGKESALVITLEFATGSAEPTALICAVPTKEIPFVCPFEFKNVKLP